VGAGEAPKVLVLQFTIYVLLRAAIVLKRNRKEARTEASKHCFANPAFYLRVVMLAASLGEEEGGLVRQTLNI
jgi:hypothetical protein